MNVRTRVAVAVVDTGTGNLRSVEKALQAAGADVSVTADADAVARADKVVVPGQGAFGGCMAGLSRGGGALAQAVTGAIAAGRPYLGICLGLQVLFEGSEEDPSCRGLGLFRGQVRKFAAGNGTGHADADGMRIKVPHMGWNGTARGPAAAGTRVLDATPDGTFFYFVHSYYADPANAGDVALSCTHGVSFCAAVARDNVFACQFHPEKSQAAGLGILRAFVSA